VVDQQELHHGLLCALDAVRLSVDDHSVLDRCGAGCLELRDAFDLNKAHAACPNRTADLWFVTEDWDLNVATTCGINEDLPVNGRDIAAINREGYCLVLGARHRLSTGLRGSVRVPLKLRVE